MFAAYIHKQEGKVCCIQDTNESNSDLTASQRFITIELKKNPQKWWDYDKNKNLGAIRRVQNSIIPIAARIWMRCLDRYPGSWALSGWWTSTLPLLNKW